MCYKPFALQESNWIRNWNLKASLAEILSRAVIRDVERVDVNRRESTGSNASRARRGLDITVLTVTSLRCVGLAVFAVRLYISQSSRTRRNYDDGIIQEH